MVFEGGKGDSNIDAGVAVFIPCSLCSKELAKVE